MQRQTLFFFFFSGQVGFITWKTPEGNMGYQSKKMLERTCYRIWAMVGRFEGGFTPLLTEE